MWSKFGKSSILFNEKSYEPQFYEDLTRKNKFLEVQSWFKFKNLGLALGMALNIYTSVAKDG